MTKKDIIEALADLPEDTPIMLLTARGVSLPLRAVTTYKGKRGNEKSKIFLVP